MDQIIRSISHHLISSLIIALLISCQQIKPAPVEVKIEPWGPGQAQIEQITEALPHHPDLSDYFDNMRYRLLSLVFKDNFQMDGEEPTPPTDFKATYYIYSRNLPIEISGSIENLQKPKVTELDYQPLPSTEEVDTALDILMQNRELATALENDQVRIYQPLPPVIVADNGHRMIVFGVHSDTASIPAEFVGIDLIDNTLYRDVFIGVDFDRLRIHPCLVPGKVECPQNGTSGMYKVVIQRNGQIIWSLYAVRPAASSGHPTKGSGIELRQVRYKGKLVLTRAHAPILNVQYKDNKCPSYRDWLHEETCFKAEGKDIGQSGFRISPKSPKTIFDQYDDDSGNFRGVAVHTHRDIAALKQGDEVFLVSELAAGWYRYLSQWSFLMDGTIKPRFGFAAVENYCTCFEHTHHVYWRFDFDIHSFYDNVAEEFIEIGGKWHLLRTIHKEEKRFRDPSLSQKWRIRYKNNRYYDIVPGHHDGSAQGDSFAKGDIWILRYHNFELYDGVKCVSGCDVTAQLDPLFVNEENVNGQNLVVWYRANYHHKAFETSSSPIDQEIVGPDLIPSSNYAN